MISPYDAKVVNEWNLYGLPMLRLGSGIPPAPPPPPPLHTDPATNLQAASFDVSPAFTPVTIAGVGKYYKADNGIQSTPRRPLEPLVSLDVTEPASVGVAHGAFLRLLNSPVNDETPFTARVQPGRHRHVGRPGQPDRRDGVPEQAAEHLDLHAASRASGSG